MIYLSTAEAIQVIAVCLGHEPEVRDWGLLESALARPRTMVFGVEVYDDLWTKAGALMHSLVSNHALISALVSSARRSSATSTAIR